MSQNMYTPHTLLSYVVQKLLNSSYMCLHLHVNVHVYSLKELQILKRVTLFVNTAVVRVNVVGNSHLYLCSRCRL